jgi:pyruvate/2-oxoglutarate dehydrogenase complex dihydrolipoamide dehydrogenase (E3) component
MSEDFDVIVLGMGPGGEVAASRLLAAGRKVAVVERELICGECAYWGCIPSKTLLRPPDARAEAVRAAGLSRPTLDWPALRDYRDYMIRHLDDAKQVQGYADQGATVIKATGRITGRTSQGRLKVEADGRQLRAQHVILATGSQAIHPDIPGLGEGSDVPVWTNREATNLVDIPDRVLMIGGSAVAVELGQFLARMGSQVTLVQRGDRLMAREEPRVGELAQNALEADGIDVRLNSQVTGASATTAGGKVGANVEIDDGTTSQVDVIVLGTGRAPRTAALGLDAVGVDPADGLNLDENCRLADGLWAIGDVTGQAMFTHVAKYQARVVADTILGKPRSAHYEGIPRVVFADPEIAAVGITTTQAHHAGLEVTSTEVDLPEAIARPWTYETDPRGTLGLLADRHTKVLVGAWAVAPLAGEWIHKAALAIRARIPLEILRDQVAQFPTYSEAYLAGLDKVDT